MALSGLGSIVTAITILTLVALISVPLLTQVTDNQTVMVYNSLNQTNQQLMGQQIYQPLNKTTMSGTGFAASIQAVLGYAFIFPAIFQFMQAITRLPQVFFIDMNGVLTTTGIASLGAINIIAVIGLLSVYMGLYLLTMGVGSWQKFNFWNN